MINEIVFYPLHKLSELIKNRTISSKELITIFHNHISTHDKEINCITDLKTLEELLIEADFLDKKLDNGIYIGPLHGIPMTIKDTFDVKGMKSCNGDPLLINNIAKNDASLISQLKDAGVIIIGKTNLPLLAIDWISDNYWFGRTNNPYDLTRVPGGSSGGSAAALASGFTPLELGSDAGGSVRVPAHFCGVCGLRPTDGLFSNDGQFKFPGKAKGLRYITVPGPMARNITDLKILFDLFYSKKLAVNNAPLNIENYAYDKNKPLNIAYSKTINGVEIDIEYQKVFNSFIEKLKQDGHYVIEQQPEFNYKKSYTSWATIMGFDFGINMPGIIFEKYVMWLFMYIKYRDYYWATGMKKGISGNTKAYASALEFRDELSYIFDSFLTEFDIWLTPVTSDCAFHHQKTGKPFIINNKKIKYTDALASFNFITALPGHPISVIPIGSIKNDMPVGIQIHCKRWNDIKLLEIAEALEKLTVGFKKPTYFT